MSKLQKTDAIVNIILFIKENIQSVLGVTTFSCCSFFVYYFDNYLIEIISIISFLILLCLLGLLDYRNNSRIVNQQNISVFKNNKYDSLNKENEIIISKKDLDPFKFFISNIKQNDILCMHIKDH